MNSTEPNGEVFKKEPIDIKKKKKNSCKVY